MSNRLSGGQIEDLAAFVEGLTSLCSERGFRPFSWSDLDIARLDGEAIGPTLVWGGNDDDGYEFILEFK